MPQSIEHRTNHSIRRRFLSGLFALSLVSLVIESYRYDFIDFQAHQSGRTMPSPSPSAQSDIISSIRKTPSEHIKYDSSGNPLSTPVSSELVSRLKATPTPYGILRLPQNQRSVLVLATPTKTPYGK